MLLWLHKVASQPALQDLPCSSDPTHRHGDAPAKATHLDGRLRLRRRLDEPRTLSARAERGLPGVYLGGPSGCGLQSDEAQGEAAVRRRLLLAHLRWVQVQSCGASKMLQVQPRCAKARPSCRWLHKLSVRAREHEYVCCTRVAQVLSHAAGTPGATGATSGATLSTALYAAPAAALQHAALTPAARLCGGEGHPNKALLIRHPNMATPPWRALAIASRQKTNSRHHSGR
jgi:hypothetical protein